ncbi:DUF397 domain-containing protein [Streptomyces spectabilis]|uniref:DUF397 domain-containing protein n=1 Tax=Streptomyces spectabilis TaxID=68270 RepID=A0A5P2XDZ8_STRST|nr:DUF397 domain-containing protein [Streptomyces spectabilis]MBB5104997.1 hypothetical protein [Streptomyces spectabilis]MCI3905729.1 DUF397 domain-containing protein [Streptomyces spectabilis]QEV62678.1 DUF397 domain-containing protein [Streptomyces spectabilis]GGV06969.1 hypothetical protein GCM10010245_14130 [Streptomyces spectabilis]
MQKPRYENDSLAWFKSSYSAGDGGECVEVAESLGSVHVRDSKDTNRPGLVVDGSAWTAFVGFARR